MNGWLAASLALLAVWTVACLRAGRWWGERRLMARLARIAADAPADKQRVFIRHLAREIGLKPPDD
jgi:hypothetical protein